MMINYNFFRQILSFLDHYDVKSNAIGAKSPLDTTSTLRKPKYPPPAIKLKTPPELFSAVGKPSICVHYSRRFMSNVFNCSLSLCFRFSFSTYIYSVPLHYTYIHNLVLISIDIYGCYYYITIVIFLQLSGKKVIPLDANFK